MTRARDGGVLIRVDGSREIGLGHIFRMRTLASALRGEGREVAFLTRADSVSGRLLGETGLACFSFSPERYLAVRQQAIAEHRPGLIVQDILRTAASETQALRELSPARIVNFDDVGAGLDAADAVINGIAFCWGAYSSQQVRTRLFEGPRYMILQPGVGEHARKGKAISDRVARVLLAFGGTDTHHVTERALAAVNRVEATLAVTVNLGPGAEETSGLRQAIAASPHRVRLIRAAPDLPGECHGADLVLCAGGIMLYELAAMGVPSVSIATETHEIPVADYWAGVGSTLSQGREADLDLKALAAAVAGLIGERGRRESMSRRGTQAMDVQGLARVMKIIREVAG